MKYYSEVLDDFFDTEQELIDAEADQKEKDMDELEVKTEQEILRNKIEAVCKNIDEAIKSVRAAEEQVKELQKKYDEEIEAIDLKYDELVNDIMSPVNQDLRAHMLCRDELLLEYNQKYGPYTNVFTGKDALNRCSHINNLFNTFLKEIGIY